MINAQRAFIRLLTQLNKYVLVMALVRIRVRVIQVSSPLSIKELQIFNEFQIPNTGGPLVEKDIDGRWYQSIFLYPLFLY